MEQRHGERILDVERKLATMQAELQAAHARLAMSQGKVFWRLAEVTNSPATGDRIFRVRFVDGQFPKQVGQGSLSLTARQDQGKFYLYSLLENPNIVQGSVVPAFEWNGYWYTCCGSGEPGEPEQMAIAEVCDGTTNDCCVWPGIVHRNDGGEACNLQRCFELVWITCQNRDLEPGVNYCEEGLLPCVGGIPTYCSWARDMGQKISCDGDERQLWAIACPCAPCECPEPDVAVKAKWTMGNIACDFPDFTLKCVPHNPITGDVGVGNQGWWGEVTIDGYYPRMGLWHGLESSIEFSPPGGGPPETIDEVLVVFVSNGGGACAPGQIEFWVDYNGDHYQVSAGLVALDPLGSLIGPWVQIRPSLANNCASFAPRTYHYGLYAECDPSSARPWVEPVVMYHLPPDYAATTLQCMGGPTVIVPQLDADYYNDDNGGMPTVANSSCCGVSPKYTMDVVFGNNNETVCSLVPMGDLNNLSLNYNSMQWHLFGGCKDFYASEFGPTGTGDMEVCDGNASHDQLLFHLLWEGREKECVQDDASS